MHQAYIFYTLYRKQGCFETPVPPPKKKYQLQGSPNIDFRGIWEGGNHVTDQIQTLYTKRYFKEAGMLSYPGHCESELQ